MILAAGFTSQAKQPVLKANTDLKIPFMPEKYICYQSDNAIVVDGDINDKDWQKAPWSNAFVDIEGSLKPKPAKETKIKMLWDSNFLYIAAELTEDHIWANITKHDAVIFYDNDFEVFIDPDANTHHYMEFEMNALNTTWDLMLTKPYRDNGHSINSWEIPGIKSAVKIYGSINNPNDTDEKWTIEIAFPWKVLNECNEGIKMPTNGAQWRMSFSRVQWITEIIDGKYVKKKDSKGKKLAENNWVWSPQGVIAMHQPETWGYVQFSSQKNEDTFQKNEDEKVKWALRQVYYRQKAYWQENNCYTSKLKNLRMEEVKLNNAEFKPNLFIYSTGYIASSPSLSDKGRTWYIQNDGKIWSNKE
jgi:hypothetical protein